MDMLYFTAKWCKPCQTYGPRLQAIAEELGIKIERVDIDEDTERARDNGVAGVPYVILYSDTGYEIERIYGAHPKIESHLRGMRSAWR